MKIAIHHSNKSKGYSHQWVDYCKKNQIDFKIVNAYDNDIVQQIADCDAFLWHFSHKNPKDMNFAKQLLFSLQQSGKKVFPDFFTGWHFDDKLGQKYLFEANDIKAARAYAFYNKKDAILWAKTTSYPKVFKLRGGAGSYNVLMAHNYNEAARLIRRSFGRGFKSFDKIRHFWDVSKEFFRGDTTFKAFLSALSLVFRRVSFDKLPIQREYSYFQDFIPNEGYDYRIEVCGNKCISMVRYARKGDFRASGGHNDHFDKDLIPVDVIAFAFDIVDKLQLQSAALDIVRHKDTRELFLVEVSYCYGVDKDEFDHGYWDRNANWHNEQFNGCDWMIEQVISDVTNKSKESV